MPSRLACDGGWSNCAAAPSLAYGTFTTIDICTMNLTKKLILALALLSASDHASASATAAGRGVGDADPNLQGIGSVAKSDAALAVSDDSSKNVYSQPLAPCSRNGMAKTGFARTGQCVDQDGDTGSHHICIDLSSATPSGSGRREP